jgi:hypothetical protein
MHAALRSARPMATQGRGVQGRALRALAPFSRPGIGQLVAIFLVATYVLPAWTTPCFDDKNLVQLRHQQPQGSLVYVWSPRMLLSAQHAASAQRQAQLRGLAFVPLHDIQLPESERQAALARMRHTADPQLQASAHALAASQSLCAPSLLARDALRHFPTAFVVQPGGQLHRHALIGAMPETAWAHSLRQRLEQP